MTHEEYQKKENEIIEEILKNAKKRSLSGQEVKRKKNTISINKSKFYKSLSVLIATTFVAGGLTLGMPEKIINHVTDKRIVSDQIIDCHDEVINNVKSRTEDGKGFYLDYKNIAEYIKSEEDFDKAVYLVHEAIEMENLDDIDNQMDRVFEYTDFEDYSSYLDARGFNDSEEFEEASKKEILLESRIHDKTIELEELNSKYPKTDGKYESKGENSL